jgi:hypothetical protein
MLMAGPAALSLTEVALGKLSTVSAIQLWAMLPGS